MDFCFSVKYYVKKTICFEKNNKYTKKNKTVNNNNDKHY